MKKIKLSLSVLITFLVLSTQLIAAENCLTGKEFSELKKTNKNLVVVDARKATEYDKMHIMKSVNIPHQDLYKAGAVEGLIKEPADLAAYFGKKGISNTSAIVIYDDGSSKYNTRVYWVLKYMGAENVQILHKDMNQWKMARIPLTKSVVPAKKETFIPKVNKAILADMPAVKASAANANSVLVDARDAVEYDGSFEKSEGHIPGAINIPYKEVLEANGSFKSKAELEALASKYGLTADKEVIIYCMTSVRASVIYFALSNVLGYTNVKVYDGAYNEWVADKTNSLDK